MPNSSIHLKAYRCQDGRREIHYAVARLRRDPKSCNSTPAPASILDMSDGDDDAPTAAKGSKSKPSTIGHCFVFFYPMGPNRRLLDAVVSRYAPKFECDIDNKDVLFLCVNRPGKGGTSPSGTETKQQQHDRTAPDERQHVRTSVNDVVTILDHCGVGRASLLYMCAGSTYAYSFASMFPERSTGYILGIASWVLRSGPSSSSQSSSLFAQCGNNRVESVEKGDGHQESDDEIQTPRMNSLTHRMAMSGVFGPRWMVSYMVGGIVGSSSTMLSSVPPAWVGKSFRKDLSEDEATEFDKQFPDGEKFVELLKWIHGDGFDDEASVFVNGGSGTDADGSEDKGIERNNNTQTNEGNARDIAVCLSTQQDLGLVYKRTVPAQKKVLLWHGLNDKMVSVAGARYLEAMIGPRATLTRIKDGTHQGVMFFFPESVMKAMNQIVSEVEVV